MSSAFDHNLQPVKVQGQATVLLSAEEKRCFQLAQAYRRRALWQRLMAVHGLLWPRGLAAVPWAGTPWRRLLQVVLWLMLWPPLFLWAVILYLGQWLLFPLQYLQTLRAPTNFRAPGEKTLQGIHHAFSPALAMPESDYVACLDRWVRELFGDEVAAEKNLSVYLAQRQQEILADPGPEAFTEGLRSNLRIARERLSRDLGHYSSKAFGSRP